MLITCCIDGGRRKGNELPISRTDPFTFNLRLMTRLHLRLRERMVDLFRNYKRRLARAGVCVSRKRASGLRGFLFAKETGPNGFVLDLTLLHLQLAEDGLQPDVNLVPLVFEVAEGAVVQFA